MSKGLWVGLQSLGLVYTSKGASLNTAEGWWALEVWSQPSFVVTITVPGSIDFPEKCWRAALGWELSTGAEGIDAY